MNDFIDDIIGFLTEERIKQIEKEKKDCIEFIQISKEQLIKNMINFLKEMKNN